MKNKILIFISAARDLQYALDIYDKYNNEYQISIVCIKIEGIYKYIKALKLSLKELLFIPYQESFNIKNPLSIVKERKRLKNFYKKELSKINNTKIFFFTVWFDWIVFSFINKLNANNEIFFVNYIPFLSTKEVNNNTIKNKILLTIYNYITNSNNLCNILYNNKKVLFFPFNRYNIRSIKPELPNINILNKYSYSIKLTQKKSILFLENDLSRIIVNYKKRIIELLNNLFNKGYKIYIKGHPNWGCSICNKETKYEIIPQYIPVELINTDSFNIIIGITTHSLIDLTYRRKNVYSIIDFFEFKEREEKTHLKGILLKQTKSKIKFISNFNEI